MSNLSEQPTFEIDSVIEQQPFQDPAVQNLFGMWCEVNDSIEPRVVDRQLWEEEMPDGVLLPGEDGRQILCIPNDLQLSEMVPFIEAVDRSTFEHNPERQTQAKDKLEVLGTTFQHVGVYVAQRVGHIEEGREAAEALAKDMYQYGHSLTNNQPVSRENLSIEDIATQSLTPDATVAIDRYLAGNELYQSRLARVEREQPLPGASQDELIEEQRQQTLKQFFRVAARGLAMQDENSREGALVAKVERSIKGEIVAPQRELFSSIFRRGVEVLQRNMPFDALPDDIKGTYLHWQNGEATLREALQIDHLKEELEAVRQTGNSEQVSAKELEIAGTIQAAMAGFDYALGNEGGRSPSTIKVNQKLNCVGASILGGALLAETGVNYLVGGVPNHAFLLVITSNDRVYIRDMIDPPSNKELTESEIKQDNLYGDPNLTVKDVVAFNKSPDRQGLFLHVEKEFAAGSKWLTRKNQQRILLMGPKYGHEAQLVLSVGSALMGLGDIEADKRAAYQAIELAPRFLEAHTKLVQDFYQLGRYEEALEWCRRAADINPRDYSTYSNLATILGVLGRTDEAMAMARKANEFIDETSEQ